MAAGHKVVVDGSNIATEGRSAPSLAQLDEAVRAYLAEHPKADITVVVDATFGHRIDESERQLFEEARSAGEMVSPPAGAIGRGDAFLLRIAEKTGATVLSNDSFQEFHGEHDWLFTTGRLIGGVPVAGVGWIFTPRSPVRGPKSRQSVQEAKRERRRGAPKASKEASGPMPVPSKPPPGRRQKAEAIAAATEEATESSGAKRRRRRRGRSAPSEPLNDPLPFLTFVSAHPLGSELEGQVDEFSSHGAFVVVGDVRCYIPLSAMGEPPPRAAREVLDKGETRAFVVQALDPQRRGIELALPGFAHVAGAPTEETVEAEIEEAKVAEERAARGERSSGRAPAKSAKKSSAKKSAARKSAAKKATEKKAASEKATEKKAAAAKAPAKKAPAKKAPAKKAPAKKATEKKAAAEKEPAKKAAARKPTAKKASATKASAMKATAAKATAAKATATKAATKKAPAKKATAKKAAAKKVVAKKAPAKKAAAKKAAGKSTARRNPARKSAAEKP